jgi:hypothetical protein
MLKQNDKVILKRDITRREGPYANKGDEGVIEELFTSGTGAGERNWNAKVRMASGRLQTFKISSLEKIQ